MLKNHVLVNALNDSLTEGRESKNRKEERVKNEITVKEKV